MQKDESGTATYLNRASNSKSVIRTGDRTAPAGSGITIPPLAYTASKKVNVLINPNSKHEYLGL